MSSIKKTWTDDTLVFNILVYLFKQVQEKNVRESLSENDEKLVKEWTQILEKNFYTKLCHIREMDAFEWAALKLPLRLFTIGRIQIWPREEISETAKKKTRKNISSEAVRKVSKSTVNLKEFTNRKMSKRGSMCEISKQGSDSDLLSGEAEIENIKASRVHTAGDESNKDNKNRRKLTRTTSTKLKTFRDLTINSRNESSKDDKDINTSRCTGSAVIGGLNTYVEELVKLIAKLDPKRVGNSNLIQFSVSGEPVDILFRNLNKNISLLPEIVIAVFSIIDPRSLNNIMLQYLPLIKSSKRDHLMFLVGLNANKRDSNDRKHISFDQANQALKTLKGISYIEINDESDLQYFAQQIGKTVIRSEKIKVNKNSNWISKLPLLQRMVESNEVTESVTLKRCKLEYLPPQIIYLRNTLSRLKLPKNLLKYFPDEIMCLELLVELDLSDNLITDLPVKVINHKNLTKLNLENNRIPSLEFAVEHVVKMKNNNWDLKLKGNAAYATYQKLKKVALSRNDENDIFTISKDNQIEIISRTVPVFGTSLKKLIEYEKTVYPTLNIQLPLFVRKCINTILTSPLEQQGLFRLEGSNAIMQDYRNKFDAKLNTEFNVIEDINSICGLLKLWFRTLPEPILGDTTPLMNIMKSDDKKSEMITFLKNLPKENYIVVSQLMRLLYILTLNSDSHKMDAQNLSTVMATNLTWSETTSPSLEMLDKIQQAQEATTYIIENYPLFFEKTDIFKMNALSDTVDPKVIFYTKLVGKHKAITSVCIGRSTKDENACRIWTADEKGMVHIWDAVKFELVKTMEVGSRINTMTVSNDTVWIGSIDNIQIFDLLHGNLKKKIGKPGYCFTHAKDNILSCVYSNNSGIISCIDKKKFKIKKEFKVTTRILSLAATATSIWAACQDKSIRVWDINTFEFIKQFDSIHNDKINHLCFVPKDNDLSEVWSSSDDHAVHVWNAKTMELEERLLSFHKNKVTGACHVGSQVWTYTWDACVYRWDKETRDFLEPINSYHSQPISSLTTDYNKDSDIWNVVSVSYDHTAVVWKCRN